MSIVDTNAEPPKSFLLANPMEIAAEKKELIEKEAQRLFDEESEAVLNRLFSEYYEEVGPDGGVHLVACISVDDLKTEKYKKINGLYIVESLRKIFESWPYFQEVRAECKKQGVCLSMEPNQGALSFRLRSEVTQEEKTQGFVAHLRRFCARYLGSN